jgi:hypothetical protein
LTNADSPHYQWRVGTTPQTESKMKISQPDYVTISDALTKTLADAKLSRNAVQSVAQIWQVFHHAWSRGLIDGNALYRKYNDAHIETALKKFFSNNS